MNIARRLPLILCLLLSLHPLNAESQEVVLKIGDIVSVNVFDENSLTGAFQVGPTGNIVFPLLGGIPSVGLSPTDLASAIEQRLEAEYIRDAQVAVALAEEAELPPNTVTVIGQVSAPGQIPFKVGTSLDLFTAIASAGGLTERGNKSRIELKRRSGSDLTTQILNLETNRVSKLQDGDTLIVHAIPEVIMEEEQVVTITVIGEVKNPGQIPMNPDTPLDLIGAIAMAGGFTDLARPSKVVIRRRTEAGVKTYEVNVSKMQKDQTQPFILAPNDTISVPESFF